MKSFKSAARSTLRTSCCLLTVGVALLGLTRTAEAVLVERVVAVIEDHPILLSDLKVRARPYLMRIYSEVPNGAQQHAAISQVHKELLDRVIDEELQQRAATKAHLTISAQEVDDALARVAAQNNVTVDVVLKEAVRNGLSEESYRHEIRQQLLEAKLMNLRLQGRIRVSEEELRAAYQKVLVRERETQQFRGAWIRIQAPLSASRQELEEKRALSERLVRQLRSGASFRDLAARYSEDPKTRAMGGLLPPQSPNALPSALRTAALQLNLGETSEPIRDGDALVILQVVERDPSQVPEFSKIRAQLGQGVYMDKMNKARREWLDSLRRRTHVEVRL